jgi:uncharacterized membrane protein YhaH (DUF805 family)
MADVFLSYSREDSARARRIAEGLQAAGLEVFWDVEIPPGMTWADFLEEKLAVSKTAVVLWSANSTGSPTVREEARIARDRSKLIPVLLDEVSPPFGFGEIQACNLRNWAGDQNDPNWRLLLSAIARASGAAPNPRPQAQPQPQPQYAYANAHPTSMQGGAQLSALGYFKKCLSPWINGKGRARRAEYWWFMLFYVLAIFGLAILDAIWSAALVGEMTPILTLIGIVYFAGPAISVAVRRLHDVGLNGWLYLLVVVPYLGALFMLVVGLIPGQDKDNQYGPNPKAV